MWGVRELVRSSGFYAEKRWWAKRYPGRGMKAGCVGNCPRHHAETLSGKTMKSWQVKVQDGWAVGCSHSVEKEDLYTKTREKELSIYIESNYLSNSSTIKEDYLLWLNCHLLRTSQTQSLSPSYFPFSAFVDRCLPSFGTFSKVALLYHQRSSFLFLSSTGYFLTYISCLAL